MNGSFVELGILDFGIGNRAVACSSIDPALIGDGPTASGALVGKGRNDIGPDSSEATDVAESRYLGDERWSINPLWNWAGAE